MARKLSHYFDGTAWPFHVLAVWLCFFILAGGLIYA